MSLTRSHPLYKQPLRFSQPLRFKQVNSHRYKIWEEARAAAYSLRNSINEEFPRRIKSARADGDDALALALEEQWALEYKKIKGVIDGFNFHPPHDYWEANYSDIETHRRQALLTVKLDLISILELSDPAGFAAWAILSDEIPSPPGETIRSTPHRPGAPFSLLPH